MHHTLYIIHYISYITYQTNQPHEININLQYSHTAMQTALYGHTDTCSMFVLYMYHNACKIHLGTYNNYTYLYRICGLVGCKFYLVFYGYTLIIKHDIMYEHVDSLPDMHLTSDTAYGSTCTVEADRAHSRGPHKNYVCLIIFLPLNVQCIHIHISTPECYPSQNTIKF